MEEMPSCGSVSYPLQGKSMMSKRRLSVAALLAVLALVFTAPKGSAGEALPYKIGSKVADFAFKSDLGKKVRLSDYRGKTVVLVMFATW